MINGKNCYNKGNFEQNIKPKQLFVENHVVFAIFLSMKLRLESICENWSSWKLYYLILPKMKAQYDQIFILLLVNDDVIRGRKHSILH